MPKQTRRHFLWLTLGTVTALGSVAVNAEVKRQQLLALDDPKRDFSVLGKASLKQRAAQNSLKLLYGTAVKQNDIAKDALYAQNVVSECAIITPELELKWYASDKPLRPSSDKFDFSAADALLAFTQTHGLKFRGHTLVWHHSLPPWFKSTVTPQNAKTFLEQHIRTVVGRYAGKVHSWDVVNEAIEEGYLLAKGRQDGLRNTPWLELLGTDYIDYAFRLTREVDPQASLVYNDYGLDYDTAHNEAKRNAVLKLLENLKSKGTPIDAFGMQAHLDASKHRAFKPNVLRKFLRNVADLGLKIMITELDVIDKELPLGPQHDRIVAAVYEDYLNVALQEKAVQCVQTWGLSDKYTWLSEFQPRNDGAPVRPLLLDTSMNRKLAWNAVARAFSNMPAPASFKHT
jgi:endo-1,4-beta-xylanase